MDRDLLAPWEDRDLRSLDLDLFLDLDLDLL